MQRRGLRPSPLFFVAIDHESVYGCSIWYNVGQ
jgi:hypothetical protein